jgi:hypothetical protein
VTLIFCPGFRLLIPTPAELPDGFGTTFTGASLFVFDPLAEGFGVALGVTFGVALTLGDDLPSTTVTLIFCPGNKFSIFIAPFDLSVPVLGGLIARGFFLEFGVGVEEDFGLGLAGEDGFGEGFGVGLTEGVGDGVGLTEGVGDGVGFTVGTGVGVGLAESSGFEVGLVEGSGVGAGVASGVGAGTTGEAPPDIGALGAGELGADETLFTCSGVIGSEGSDGEDSPTDVTVVTVNV